MKVHVWYDASSEIIAVGHSIRPESDTTAAADQFVLETEIDEALSRFPDRGEEVHSLEFEVHAGPVPIHDRFTIRFGQFDEYPEDHFCRLRWRFHGDRHHVVVRRALARYGGREIEAGVGSCAHNIDHRLGLTEIETPIEEGTQCKLPRPRRPTTLAKAELNDALQSERTAMAVNLKYVLPCIRAGRTHQTTQRLIDNRARDWVDDLSMSQLV